MEKEKIANVSKQIIKNHPTCGIDKVGIKGYKKFETYYIDIVYKSLLTGEYKFTKYKQLLKIKGKDKNPRVISIPCLRDRLMLTTIYQYELKPLISTRKKVYELIENIREGIKNGFFDSFIKIDLKNFFDSIDINILNKAMKNLGLSNEIINIISNALKTNTIDSKENTRKIPKIDDTRNVGVPQGIIISNALAEIYMKDFDDYFDSNEFCSSVKAFRFVDDILFFFNSKKISCQYLGEKVKFKLLDLRLGINENKRQEGFIHSTTFEFLGYEFRNGIVTLSERIIQKKEKRLERIVFDSIHMQKKRKMTDNFLIWKLNLEITGFIFNNKRYGWLNTYSSIDDLSILYRLDSTLKSILLRAKKEKIDVKSFVEYYYKIKKKHNMKNFDKEYSTYEEKKKFLENILELNCSSIINTDDIDDIFYSFIKKTVYDFERDLDFKYGI